MLNIEIITTGEEVLSGQITDTNASWLAAELVLSGLHIRRKTTVGDRLQDLVDSFQERSRCADIIFVNGGLGPTSDDLSSEAAALALGERLVLFPDWVAVLEARFAQENRYMSPENLKQAHLPESAQILDNPVGTACGFRFVLNDALFYFTPGVPSEFKRMVRREILPDIKKRFVIENTHLLKRLHCFGVAESRLGGLLNDIVLPPGVKLGFRAHLPTIEIKVMGISEQGSVLSADMDRVADCIRKKMGSYIIYEEEDTLANCIQRLMIQKGYTLALAESCTGGMIASQIVNIPQSSAYFDRSFVTYSNEAKVQMLGVPASLIEQYGAVSQEVVQAMAQGARHEAASTHALSVSGIAGPGGGSVDKPVGLIALALATPQLVISQVLRLPAWGRNTLRRVAAELALDMLRRHLIDVEVCADFDHCNTLQSDTRHLGGQS